MVGSCIGADLLVLEPRILFDAAGVAVAAQAVDYAESQAVPDTAAVIPEADTTTQPVGDVEASAAGEQSPAAMTTEPLVSEPAAAGREIVFIDPGVEDYQILLAGIEPRAEVVLLNGDRDGMEQIAEVLAGRTDIDAVHIISHGTQAELTLGTSHLTLESMNDAYADELAVIGQSLSEKADLLIYGCNFGQGERGAEAAMRLAQLTGADVAASTDDTGNASLGGDWDLEHQTGQIDTNIAVSAEVQQDWSHVMAVGIDATSTGQTTGSSVTISHTTSSTSDRLMLVGVSIGEDSPPSVSSVTYNGSSLTFKGSVQSIDGGIVEIWYLVAPSDGTHNVVVNLSGSGDANVGVMTFTGVDQTTPLGAFASASGDATSGSATVSSATGELVFGVVTVNALDQNLVPGAGQTERWDLFTGVESNGGSSTEAGAASVAMSWSWSDSTGWAIGGVSIKASSSAPTITNLSGDSLSYAEGDGAVLIEQGGNATVSDADSANFDSGTLTVSFTAGSDSAEDVLAIRNQGTGAGQIGVSGANVTYQGVTIGTFAGGSGGSNLVITMNSSATPIAAQALLRNITYQDTDTAAPTTGARTVRFVLTDGDGGTSANHDTTVTVSGVNDAPSGGPTITGTVTEDQTLTANTAGISDADGLGAFSYQWLRNGVAVGGATASTYLLGDADVGALMSVRVTYTDGQGTAEGPLTSAQTAAVANVNDAPVVTNLSGDSLAYSEGDGAVVIEQGGTAAVSDVDSTDFDTGILTVAVVAGGDSNEDVLNIRNQGTGAGQIGVSGANVTYEGVVIGTFAGGTPGNALVVTLNSSATPTAVTALVRNVTYENTDTVAPTTG
ncbi:MAG: hypothetical protein HW416_1991, partial [Chloroflexi bacterium]|nr:hypothetical protein [Chloroflexota bacterium]